MENIAQRSINPGKTAMLDTCHRNHQIRWRNSLILGRFHRAQPEQRKRPTKTADEIFRKDWTIGS